MPPIARHVAQRHL